MKYVYVILFIVLCLSLYYLLAYSNLFFQKNQASQDNIFGYLSVFKKGIVTSTTLAVTNTCKILAIDTKTGTIPETKSLYTARILLRLENNEDTYLYFVQPDLENTKIFIQDSSGDREGTTSNLKIGDTILLEKIYKYDLKAPKRYSTIISRKITKINK